MHELTKHLQTTTYRDLRLIRPMLCRLSYGSGLGVGLKPTWTLRREPSKSTPSKTRTCPLRHIAWMGFEPMRYTSRHLKCPPLDRSGIMLVVFTHYGADGQKWQSATSTVLTGLQPVGGSNSWPLYPAHRFSASGYRPRLLSVKATYSCLWTNAEPMRANTLRLECIDRSDKPLLYGVPRL